MTDQEIELRNYYRAYLDGRESLQDFTSWFRSQSWPNPDETSRMFQTIAMTHNRLASIEQGEIPEDLGRSHLNEIGDYLQGRTDQIPDHFGHGMSRDKLRHDYDEAHALHKARGH
jgi:hypothetical protein